MDIKCPGFAYKCKYGACAKTNAECNGVVDCFDGSDEDPHICDTPPATPAPVTPVPSSEVKYEGHFLKHV